MQQHVKNWIEQSTLMRTQLERWAQTINTATKQDLAELYHPKARLFPVDGGLKKSADEIQTYFKGSEISGVKIHYRSLSYNPDDRLAEGEYTFKMLNGEQHRASFAFKFSREGLILEQASAPKNINNWRVRNEVSVCTMLTAATVQSVLKRSTMLEAVV